MMARMLFYHHWGVILGYYNLVVWSARALVRRRRVFRIVDVINVQIKI